MNGSEGFLDSNVVLYLTSPNEAKAARVESLLAAGPSVSVQVLNEFAAVARRKFRMDWSEVREMLSTIRNVCTVYPVSIGIHERGIRIAERYGFGVYDSMIVAAALEAGCSTLYSEDMQDGQTIDGLRIRNPFATR